jgi:peptidoglycan/xylan/chitin deacetylase (PgdA/CDA1 family)
VPILVYHRFGHVVADSMTVSTAVFESHLTYLKKNGYSVIPLRQLVEHRLGKGAPPPSKAVVITADDGHRSVFTDMVPFLRKYRIPVTLMVYPSAISNASYAMTWEQLREIKRTGLVDFQSHTFWHPDFKKERKRLNPVEYEKAVRIQFRKSKERLEKELNEKVDMLAWPFGIYDNELIRKAAEAGYVAAFSIERRHAKASDSMMALPRYLMADRDREKVFELILTGSIQG